MRVVLLPHPDGVRRQWFSDARDDGRRMEVSWHSHEGLVIVSLWHGSICRATFRLPADQAPALIQILEDGADDAEPETGSPAAPVQPSLFDMGRDRVKRHVAEIVTLEGRQKR
jgi:hypothetical protein